MSFEICTNPCAVETTFNENLYALFEKSSGQFSYAGLCWVAYKDNGDYCTNLLMFASNIGNSKRRFFVKEEEVFNVYVVKVTGYWPSRSLYEALERYYYNNCLIFQDCHSAEFKEWLAKESVFYNNGFYDAYKKIDEDAWVEKTSEAVSNYINTIGSFSYHGYEKYQYNYNGMVVSDEIDGSGKIIRRNNKYILRGSGYSLGFGSDADVSYKINMSFDSIDDLTKYLKEETPNCKIKFYK